MQESQENTPQQGSANGLPPTFRFKVALSFAGDNKRDRIREIADSLANKLGEDRIFFDEFFLHEISGTDADTYLQNVFLEQSYLVVTCVCSRYAEKPWTKSEWRAIKSFMNSSKLNGDGRFRFLPVRFDDGQIDGLFQNVDIIPDVRNWYTSEIVDLIIDRYNICESGVTLNRKMPEPTPPKPRWFLLSSLVLSMVVVVCGLLWWNWPPEELRQWNLEKDLASKIAKELHDNQSVSGSQMLVNQRGQFTFSLTSDASEAFIGRDFTIRFDDDPQSVTVEFNMNGTFDVSKFQAYEGKSVNVKGTIGKIEKISPVRASVNLESAMLTKWPANP